MIWWRYLFTMCSTVAIRFDGGTSSSMFCFCFDALVYIYQREVFVCSYSRWWFSMACFM